MLGGLRPRNIGARIKRVEDRRLLTGLATFTADRAVAGALHVTFRRSDHAHALISSTGTAAAAAMPGVFAVYTAQDLLEPVQVVSRLKDYQHTPFYPLAREKVRRVWWQDLRVSRGNRGLGARSAPWPGGALDRRPAGGSRLDESGLRRDYRRRADGRPRRPDPGACRRCHRRCRGLF